MTAKRPTVQDRIAAQQRRIEAEQAELARLHEIETHALPRAEWVAKLFAEHGYDAVSIRRSERRVQTANPAVSTNAGNITTA